jgi:SAM-dependent methyltransferase
MGWEYSAVPVDGATYYQCHALEPTPHNLGYVWYAPNHVRAFRRTAYEAVGGYDATLTHLEDQDLTIRLFDVGTAIRIPKLLYLQRMHRDSTRAQPAVSAAIQDDTVELYLGNIERLALAWSAHLGLESLAFRMATAVGEIVADERFRHALVEPTFRQFSLADNSVGVIRAHDVLQRVADRAHFLNECYRILAHGGLLLTDTPSTDGRGAFQDPSNVSFYNENSFSYLTRAELRPTIPTLTARLQVSHLVTYYPSDQHQELDIPYVKANLIAIKDGPRQGGPLFC